MTHNPDYFLHETTCVDEPCEIGTGTRIWHFSHIMAGARIGRDCTVGQNVVIDRDVEIGDGCKIQNNISIYKGVILKDRVFCGPSVVFTNVINPRAFIKRKSEFKTTLVQEGATLGANATIVCGVEIGAYALIGAGTVITKDVLPYALMYGVPARQAGWMCQCGVVLPADTLLCPACQTPYQLDEDGRLQPL